MTTEILDELIRTGVRLLMLDNAYHRKPTSIQTDDDVIKMIKTVIDEPPIQIDEPLELTSEKLLKQFTDNREAIRRGDDEGDDVDLTEFEKTDPECLRMFAELCFTLAIFASSELFDGLDGCSQTILSEANFTAGYWTEKMKLGQNSAELGMWSIERAKKFLKRYGGIEGYNKLPYGEKSKAVEELADALQFKNVRQAYNILKKLRK